MLNEDSTHNIVQKLNDELRQTLSSLNQPNHLIVLTPQVSCLETIYQEELLRLVTAFKDFDPGNDPHDEHDFGAIKFQGKNYFWKIDYLDLNLEYASPNPANSQLTKRVLTLMLAEEY
jgi:Protein of unknown function (DUF3768)